MTQRKDFKRLVRERMAHTGESYTTARMHLEAADRGASIRGATGPDPHAWLTRNDVSIFRPRPPDAISDPTLAADMMVGYWLDDLYRKLDREPTAADIEWLADQLVAADRVTPEVGARIRGNALIWEVGLDGYLATGQWDGFPET